MLLSGKCKSSIETLKSFCEDHNIDHKIKKNHINWGARNTYIQIFSDEDYLVIKLHFGDDYALVSHGAIEPYDVQEVKIICHDCGGYVWSVSGYEWKESIVLQKYRCTRKKDGSCHYD